MTSSCDKMRRAMLSCLSRPADSAGWLHGNGDACDGAEGTEERVLARYTEELWRVTLAKEIDGLASVVLICDMVSGSRRTQGDGVSNGEVCEGD